MRVKFIICLLLLTNIFACNTGKKKVKLIEAVGLDDDNLRLNTLLLLDKDTGFIAGSLDLVQSNPNHASDTFAFLNRVALLFKTIDGGKSWSKCEFGEGRIVNILQLEKKIYAIKANKNNNYNTYSTDDFGATWHEEVSFPQRITQLLFMKDKYLAVTQDGLTAHTYVDVSLDSGSTWKRSVSKFPILNAITFNEQLYYLSSSDEKARNLLVEYNVGNGVSEVYTLPKGFDCYFLKKDDTAIKLIGIQNEEVTVYTFQSGELQLKYSYSQSRELFPQGYYSRGDEEWLVVGKRNANNVSNVILHTNDIGGHWDVLHFEKDNYIKPFCFTTERNKVIALFYSGSSKFQLLK